MKQAADEYACAHRTHSRAHACRSDPSSTPVHHVCVGRLASYRSAREVFLEQQEQADTIRAKYAERLEQLSAALAENRVASEAAMEKRERAAVFQLMQEEEAMAKEQKELSAQCDAELDANSARYKKLATRVVSKVALDVTAAADGETSRPRAPR